MAKKWAEVFERKLGGNTKLVTMVLCGVLLFIITMPTKKKETMSSDAAANAPPVTYAAEAYAQEEYVKDLEQRLTESLSKVSGVGAVQVMISLKSSEEFVVKMEETKEKHTTSENDGSGGERNINESTTLESTVYVSRGSDKEPYVVKTILPEIEGVLVVAKGAGTGTVNRTIVDIVQALFDLDVHKVKVVKME